jgi:molybdate transport system substrate-binding protein
MAPVAGNLNVMVSVAFKGLLEQFEPEYRKTTGFGFAPVYAPAGTVVKRARAGEKADVLVITPETMKLMIDEGLGVAGSEHNIATSVVGVAVRAGAPKPKIATAEDVRSVLLAAKAVAYTDPSTGAASGVHFEQIAERMGILDAMKAKARLGDGGPVAEFVARGEADIAIQQLCEHMLVKGVDVVGPLPDELNRTTTFTAGVTRSAAAPNEAAALIKLLLAPHVRAAMPSHGLQPA